MANVVATVGAKTSGTLDDAVLDTIEEHLRAAAERALVRIEDFWRSSHPGGTGRSANSLRIEQEGRTIFRIVNDATYSYWVRPIGQAPHQFTTMPLLAEDEVTKAMEDQDFADALADGLLRMIKGHVNADA